MKLTDDNSPVAVMLRPSTIQTLLNQLDNMAESLQLAGAVLTAGSLLELAREVRVGMEQPAGIDEGEMLEAMGYTFMTVDGIAMTKEEQEREAGMRE